MIRDYALCKMMRWNHLPAPGGIYQQRPGLLDKFLTIARIEAEVEKKKQAAEKAKASRNGRGKRMR